MYLTRRQLELVDFIRSYRDSQRVSPTLDEIARHFGVSKITVFEHVEALQKKGVLHKVKNHARSIQLVGDDGKGGSLSIPVEGTIPDSSDGSGVRPEGISLARLAATDGSCFALRVRGDALSADHLVDGDILVVQRRQSVRGGETAVVRTERGERALRKVEKATDASTATASPIDGVVVAVVRML
jgi:repressor LexA